MKHASTRELFAYWNGRRGARVAPERAEIDPGAIRTALGDTFLLASAPDGGHTFRLAGTRVCALFGRELKGECFISLWEDADRAAARSLLRIVATAMVGVVAGAAGHSSEGPRVDLELLLLPLRHCGRGGTRMIGALAPLDAPFWIGASLVRRLRLGAWRHTATEHTLKRVGPGLRGHHPHGLVIYDGGRLNNLNKANGPLTAPE